METKPTGLKLRLHLSAPTSTTSSATESHASKKPLPKEDLDDSSDDASIFAFNKTAVDTRPPEKKPEDRSLKLTVRLKEPTAAPSSVSSSVSSSAYSSCNVPSNSTSNAPVKPTPKIVLQLSKPPVEEGGILDVEGDGDKKKTEKKRVPVVPVVAGGETVKRRRRAAKEAAKTDAKETEKAPKVVPEVRYTTPSYRLPYPPMPPQTRVPISTFTPHAHNQMTPGEREEETLLRKSLSEAYEKSWSFLTKPRVKGIPSDVDSVVQGALPYWLFLSPIESALQVSPHLRVTPITTDVDRPTYVWEEFEKLRNRLDTRVATERSRETPTELVVLEQRLCLEEEKFLFAKLKSEYNTKVSEFIAKKRQAEGLPPTVVSPIGSTSGALSSISSSSSVSAGGLSSTTMTSSHQRILPRVNSGMSWRPPTADK